MNSTVKEIAGGKWWKVDFHVHTPASMDYGKESREPEKEKQVTPKEFLLKAIEKNIDCLVISDHNSFEWIDKLREAMNELIQDNSNIAPVIIFPAVEINVMGNIHLLAIFNIDVEVRNLERIFGQIGFDEKVLSTTKSMPEVMEIVIKNKGIAIPAHVDCPSGLFETNSASEIKGVLNVDELLAFEVIGSEINNQIYKDSKRKISYVAGSDSHCIDAIGSRYTWVKMGKPSIEAMRLALFDNIDGVLRSDFYEGNPNDLKNRMFLKYIEIKQAKYAGRRAPLHIDFSPYGKKFRAHLNNLFENDYSVENEIYMWLPEDLVRLELKTGRNKYISIDAGSAGQRTSAILTLLLQMSKEPIIIDQPEDDLDTKNITDFIVKGINEKKQSQQIIVVTHNPNIVVNTNSEQVIHMEFAGGEINASHSGALQDFEIRDAICDVMEGGREALESRYYRITKALE